MDLSAIKFATLASRRRGQGGTRLSPLNSTFGGDAAKCRAASCQDSFSTASPLHLFHESSRRFSAPVRGLGRRAHFPEFARFRAGPQGHAAIGPPQAQTPDRAARGDARISAARTVWKIRPLLMTGNHGQTLRRKRVDCQHFQKLRLGHEPVFQRGAHNHLRALRGQSARDSCRSPAGERTSLPQRQLRQLRQNALLRKPPQLPSARRGNTDAHQVHQVQVTQQPHRNQARRVGVLGQGPTDHGDSRARPFASPISSSKVPGRVLALQGADRCGSHQLTDAGRSARAGVDSLGDESRAGNGFSGNRTWTAFEPWLISCRWPMSKQPPSRSFPPAARPSARRPLAGETVRLARSSRGAPRSRAPNRAAHRASGSVQTPRRISPEETQHLPPSLNERTTFMAQIGPGRSPPRTRISLRMRRCPSASAAVGHPREIRPGKTSSGLFMIRSRCKVVPNRGTPVPRISSPQARLPGRHGLLVRATAPTARRPISKALRFVADPGTVPRRSEPFLQLHCGRTLWIRCRQSVRFRDRTRRQPFKCDFAIGCNGRGGIGKFLHARKTMTRRTTLRLPPPAKSGANAADALGV